MFQATNSPILRSNFPLYRQLLVQATNKMQQIPFIDLVNKSALHVSGDKFAHPQEHFSTV